MLRKIKYFLVMLTIACAIGAAISHTASLLGLSLAQTLLFLLLVGIPLCLVAGGALAAIKERKNG